MFLETLGKVVLESRERPIHGWIYSLNMVEKLDIRKGAVSKNQLAKLGLLFTQEAPGFLVQALNDLP